MVKRAPKPNARSTAKKKAKPSTKPSTGKKPVRRRLSGVERRKRIISAAAEFFATHGFDGSTRELASRLGVAQALLYRYFPSKDELIDCVFETEFAERWDPNWERLLKDRSLSFEHRLNRFYTEYSERSTETSTRLWMRANLADLNFATRYSGMLDSRILLPIIEELRVIANLPSTEKRPALRGERELVMALHGSVIFLSIRRNIYGTPNLDDRATIIDLQIRAYLPGAIDAIGHLHGPDASGGLVKPWRTGR